MIKMDIVTRAFKAYFDGNIERAEYLLKKFRDKRKNDYRVWLLDAMINNHKGEYEKALKSIDKGLELNSKSHEMWILRGNILEKLGDLHEALLSFEEAVKIQLKEDDYYDYETRIQQVKVLIKMGRIKRAREILTELEELLVDEEEIAELKKQINNLLES